jgi:threonine/homoserine/homoserine lactone efflux protein
MFEFQNFYLFLLATLLINITPGNDMLFVISRTLSHGTRAGYLSTFGVSIGCLFHIVLASIGLSAVIMKFSFAYEVIKYAGALYLVYLGLNSIIRKREIPFMPENKHSKKNLILQGMFTDILNPKVALFFLAFLPQFVNTHSGNTGIAFLFLGILFNIIGTIIFFVMVYFTGKITSLIRNSSTGRWMEKISGIVFVFLGITLALENKK